MAISRGAFKNRGTGYTDKGVMMRCVRADQSSVTMTLHYMHNGSAMFRVSFLGNIYSRRPEQQECQASCLCIANLLSLKTSW